MYTWNKTVHDAALMRIRTGIRLLNTFNATSAPFSTSPRGHEHLASRRDPASFPRSLSRQLAVDFR